MKVKIVNHPEYVISMTETEAENLKHIAKESDRLAAIAIVKDMAGMFSKTK